VNGSSGDYCWRTSRLRTAHLPRCWNRYVSCRMISVHRSQTSTFFFVTIWLFLWRTVLESAPSVTSNASNLLEDQPRLKKRLNNLSLLNIESDLLQKLDFCTVIKAFSSAKCRKRSFWLSFWSVFLISTKSRHDPNFKHVKLWQFCIKSSCNLQPAAAGVVYLRQFTL